MALPIGELRKIRLEKLEKIRNFGINPYPSRWEKEREKIAKIRQRKTGIVRTSGRIMAIRGHGGSTFIDLIDESGKLQLFFGRDFLDGQMKKWQEKYKTSSYEFLSLLDIGDFLAAEGELFETKAGELTLKVSDYCLLTKSIRPLPSQWYGLKDTEERYRKRHLDLIFNSEVRKRFDIRTKLVKEIRHYLDDLGFSEVETPALQPLYGGANARPFITYLNALDAKMYLRIADELYLKRLLTGGYERVYEICKDFRNEGFDQTHNPEFTMIEYYEAYSDYQRVMDVTEGLFKHLAKEIYGEFSIKVGDKKISIVNSWPRIRMVDLLKEKLGLDVEKEDEKTLINYCQKNSIEIIGGETIGQLVYLIFEHKITDLLIDPTWVIDYPKDVSPLSKQKPEDSEWVERFEGYIGGKEICDGWSELTDPIEQRSRFESDVKAVRGDKEEAQQVDEDFLEAMEYGMPPMGGIGIGIDRLAMFFTNTWAIKEVMIYPTLKPVGQPKDLEKKNRGQDFNKKFVVILDKDEEIWRVMNALAHITAFLGNKMTDVFDTGDYFVTKDEIKHPRNSQYPVITLSATGEQLINLMEKVRESGLLYIGYVPEMIDTTNDDKLGEMIANKEDKNIVYLGIGIFGDADKVNALTRGLALYKK